MSGKELPTECGNCRHVSVCNIYEGMVATQQAWDARFGEKIKFPFNPLALAKLCKDYENPTQVILQKEIAVGA